MGRFWILIVAAVAMPRLALAKPPACISPGSGAQCTRDDQCCDGTVCVGLCKRGCKINKVFYENLAINPANDCQRCEAAVNRFGWTNLAAGTTCGGAPSGVCDAQNTCNGSGVCNENYKPSSTVCRSSAGICDVAENCTGSSKTCPTDSFLPSSSVCRGSAGVCDVAENCTGSAAACPTDTFLPSSTVCRASGGVCDVAENCTGSAAACPTDAVEPSSTVCRPSAGVCDVAENCTGSSANCPTDSFLPSTTVCRASAGVCDVAENCTGSSANCPSDSFLPSTFVCRASAGVCDVAENCTGSAAACPGDAVAPSTTVCRPVSDDCDAAETCDGSSRDCPADAVAPNGTLVGPARGVCDQDDFCTGTSKLPPLDVKKSGDVCRASAGACDPEETCPGNSNDCPADVKTPAGTDCSALGGAPACEIWECQGDGSCAYDRDRSATAACRAPANECDQRDLCGAPFASGDTRNRYDFTDYPECGPDVKKRDGIDCTYTPLGPDGAGKCLGGECVPLFCNNTIECAEGSVCGCPSGQTCSKNYCIPAPVDHGFGDACTGVAGRETGDCSGWLCCAGMDKNNTGAVAGPGVPGRCADCCGFADCGGSPSDCCDGRCTDVSHDPENCFACNYDGGTNCDSLVTACNPTAVTCDPESGCVLTDAPACEAEAQANGWDFFSCSVPQEVRIPDPRCDYCDGLFTPTPGKTCLTDEECGGFPGSCIRELSLICFARGIGYAYSAECSQPPFVGCTPICTQHFAPSNEGDACDDDEDCLGGTKCKTTCDLSYSWLSTYCTSEPRCRW